MCLETGDSGRDATTHFPSHPNLLGDRFVGAYPFLSPTLSYVLEDAAGVCGYVLAALDSHDFYARFTAEWLPSVLPQYPQLLSAAAADGDTTSSDGGLSQQEQELFQELREPSFFLPASLQRVFPSHLHIDLLAHAQRQGAGTRMINTILTLLKDRGSHGVHLEMSRKNRGALRFYKKLGFVAVELEGAESGSSPSDDVLILGKRLSSGH